MVKRRTITHIKRGFEKQKLLERQLKFPNCTEVFEECKGRETPCVTCPYK